MLLPRHAASRLSKRLTAATRGCRLYGMVSTIHHYILWIVGGGVIIDT
jgi:hypothetical protein